MDDKALATLSEKSAYELIGKTDRTDTDNLRMIDLAMKSKYHWLKVGTKLNQVRSDWLIARVFTEVLFFEAALQYAKSCLEITLREGFKDVDLFFAYESFVRIYHLQNDLTRRDKLTQKAKEAIHTVEKEEDKLYCQSELHKILAIHIEKE